METWWADTKPPFAHRPSAVIAIGEALVNCQPASSKFECPAGAAPPSFDTATVAGAACETPQTRRVVATAIHGVGHLRGVIITKYYTRAVLIFQHRSQEQPFARRLRTGRKRVAFRLTALEDSFGV